ncbi:hypothetical protein AV650_08260 [Serratia fonticola]|nr:hypothetical protein AV650_08260 [Serratia fonticola]
MSGYMKNSMDCFIYSHSELLSYSLVELISNVFPADELASGDFIVAAKENISDIVLGMLRSRKKTLIILDLDSVFFSEKLSIIEKFNAVGNNFKTIALCNELEYENFCKLYSAVFDTVLLKSSSLSLMKEVITNEIDNILLQERHGDDSPAASPHNHFLMLTPREDMILRKLMSGQNSNQIAKELFISNKTVYAHRSNIYAKFHVRTLSELYNCLKKEALIGNEHANYNRAW